ncbi:MAG: glycerophosphodiester phosphodiesterase, partial [Lachnospiraceae bacterium]|nr:glycerophosphodiester phosphodiesterase [Lachnospiraceae bacterium]
VVNLIKEYDFSRQCVITSARKKSLRKVKKLTKDIRTGYILSTAYGRYYLDREIDFVSMRFTMINERVVRMSHKYGKEVYVWTVNNKEDAVRLSQLGVDNLITDRPVYIRNVVYEQSDHISLFTLLKQSLLMF